MLPTVWLSGALGRRFTGRECWWWVPAIPAAGFAPLGALAALTGLAAPLTAFVTWCVSAILLGVAALFARIARHGLLVDIALWGTLMWLSVGTLCLAVLHFAD